MLFILSLSILVVLHELGHFIPAKYFGTRVSRFYLFFDFLFPFSKVLNFSLFKKKIGDTEYGIGWFPFGGYVQIAGMVDETQGEEDLDKVPASEQFRYKPAWQRLIIMVGGVSVNMVLAMVIYAGLLWVYGQQYLPMQNATNGIMVADSMAYDLGLQHGDKILQLDGKPVKHFDDFEKELVLNEAKEITVKRGDSTVNLTVKPGFITKLIKAQKPDLIAPRVPCVVQSVQKGTGAAKAGLKEGDRIVAVDSVPTEFYDQAKAVIVKHAGKTLSLTVQRAGKPVQVKAAVSAEGTLGFRPDMDVKKYFETNRVEYTFLAAIPAGIKMSFETLGKYFKGIKMIFTSKEVKASDSLGGFYSMGRIFPKTFDWQSFWSITAMISVILAFMNILPIPMLDGGYVVFLLFEMVTGKPVNEKIQNYAQMVGMAFILFLLVYANGLDAFRAFSK